MKILQVLVNWYICKCN